MQIGPEKKGYIYITSFFCKHSNNEEDIVILKADSSINLDRRCKRILFTTISPLATFPLNQMRLCLVNFNEGSELIQCSLRIGSITPAQPENDSFKERTYQGNILFHFSFQFPYRKLTSQPSDRLFRIRKLIRMERLSQRLGLVHHGQ